VLDEIVQGKWWDHEVQQVGCSTDVVQRLQMIDR